MEEGTFIWLVLILAASRLSPEFKYCLGRWFLLQSSDVLTWRWGKPVGNWNVHSLGIQRPALSTFHSIKCISKLVYVVFGMWETLEVGQFHVWSPGEGWYWATVNQSPHEGIWAQEEAVNKAAGPGGQRWVFVDFEGGALLARDCCVPEECTVLFEFPIVLGYVKLPKYACHNPQCQKGKSLRRMGKRFWDSPSGLWAEEGSGPTFSLWPQGLQPQRRH